MSDFYPTIAILPAGARNITITEITESSNNLCKLFYDGWWISLQLVILFLWLFVLFFNFVFFFARVDYPHIVDIKKKIVLQTLWDCSCQKERPKPLLLSYESSNILRRNIWLLFSVLKDDYWFDIIDYSQFSPDNVRQDFAGAGTTFWVTKLYEKETITSSGPLNMNLTLLVS